MRILLAEDDQALARELAYVLRAGKFAVDVTHNGVDAHHLGETENYDAALLDLGLPLVDGLSVLERWRAARRDFPVLLLTARTSWSDKAAGFKAGADDYLTKPFLAEEVVLRLHALIRRASGRGASDITCGKLAYHTQSASFSFEGQSLKLTAFEWRLLTALMMRKEVAVSRSELAERVYEYNSQTVFSSLEVMIGRLRRKIGAEMIETVRNHGYRLTEPPS